MEDILVHVLSLCSVETLVWIQCDEGTVFGLSLVGLRYVLHKHLPEIVSYLDTEATSTADLIQQLNKQQLCTTQVSDSYRKRHWKQYFLINQVVKRCARNGLHNFLQQWLKDEGINVQDDCSSALALRASSPTIKEDDDFLELAFVYGLKHGYCIDQFPLDAISEYSKTIAALLYNRWDLVKDIVPKYVIDIREESVNFGRYDLFVNPLAYIPRENRYLFSDKSFIPFELLTESDRQKALKYIARHSPKFLRHFDLTKDEIRILYRDFGQHICKRTNARGLVRYLRQHGLWEEFPYNESWKSLCLLLTQLHYREPIDIDATIKLLSSIIHWRSDIHWVLFVLAEWYNVDKERLINFTKEIIRENKPSLYRDYIRNLFV